MNDMNQSFTVINPKTGQAVPLAMEALWLTGRILPVGARLLVAHTFRSQEQNPLEVVYAFGLPRDAALRRFQIVGEHFRVRSELKPVAEAQKDYETGISQGHLSTLARAYRDGRINLSVGHIRPGELIRVFLEIVAGVDLRDDGLRFRFPFSLAPCYHRDARVAEVEPGVGEMELPAEEFGDVLLPRYMTDTSTLHHVGFELALQAGAAVTAVSSPSHALRVSNVNEPTARVSLSREKDVPNRDLVLDVQTRADGARTCGGACRDGKARFTIVVPSLAFGPSGRQPKSVVLVLDRSGSMAGVALDQAKRAVEACLGTLSETDQFGLVAFDNEVESFRPALVGATRQNREDAQRFLSQVQARGGTDLAQAIQAAAQQAGPARADLFVVTDGQVSATEDILGQCRSAQARLHCLGIGSASQDRFLTLLARETGGVSRFLTPSERVDLGALELFASAGQPVASALRVSFQGLAGAQTVLAPPSVVFEGHPLLVMAQAPAAGPGELRLDWGTGSTVGQMRVALELAAGDDAETVRWLHGARLITDCESQMAGEPDGSGMRKLSDRSRSRLSTKLEQLSREYGLASRAMALVAVVERAGDDASQLPTTRIVPVGMPEDVTFERYFQAQPAGGPALLAAIERQPIIAMLRETSVNHFKAATRSEIGRQTLFNKVRAYKLESDLPKGETSDDKLMALAGQLLPDGGLPGSTDEERLVRSLALLLAFLGAGHNARSGAFRLHVRQLVKFLTSRPQAQIPNEFSAMIPVCVARAEAGETLPGDLSERLLIFLTTSSNDSIMERFCQEIGKLA